MLPFAASLRADDRTTSPPHVCAASKLTSVRGWRDSQAAKLSPVTPPTIATWLKRGDDGDFAQKPSRRSIPTDLGPTDTEPASTFGDIPRSLARIKLQSPPNKYGCRLNAGKRLRPKEKLCQSLRSHYPSSRYQSRFLP